MPENRQQCFWTIGHSNHGRQKFLNLLAQHPITHVVDVRTHPYSRFAPWSRPETLQKHLQQHDITYKWQGKNLGGKPGPDRFYDDQGYVLYDRLARSPAFQQALQSLQDTLSSEAVCLMCAEENPLHCHRRRLVGHVLVEQGARMLHIRGTGRIETEADLRQRQQNGQLRLFDDQPDPSGWKSHQPVR